MPQALSCKTHAKRGKICAMRHASGNTRVSDSDAHMATICRHGATATSMPPVFRETIISATPLRSSLLHVSPSAWVARCLGAWQTQQAGAYVLWRDVFRVHPIGVNKVLQTHNFRRHTLTMHRNGTLLGRQSTLACVFFTIPRASGRRVHPCKKPTPRSPCHKLLEPRSLQVKVHTHRLPSMTAASTWPKSQQSCEEAVQSKPERQRCAKVGRLGAT